MSKDSGVWREVHEKFMLVEHEPTWTPRLLRVNAMGDREPGFVCLHVLENGYGCCGANVFNIEDSIGLHSCWVRADQQEGTII